MRSVKHKKLNLVAKANAKDLLVHGVQFDNESNEVKDPWVIGMCIIAASTDDKAIVERQVMLLRELSLDELVEVPLFLLLLEQLHEYPIGASVHLHQVLRILTAHQ